MKNTFFFSNSITYVGFDNCVKYAAIVFSPELIVSTHYTKNNYQSRAIPEFIKRVVEFDCDTLMGSMGGINLFTEFIIFKNTVLQGNAPNVQLNILEIKIIILALVYYSNSNSAEGVDCRNFLDIYDIDDPSFFEESPFFRFEFKDVLVPYSIVRFVLLTTLDGMSVHSQASIIEESRGLPRVLQNSRVSGIYFLVKEIRITFFEDVKSRFYPISKYLLSMSKKSNHNFFQHYNGFSFDYLTISTTYYSGDTLRQLEKTNVNFQVYSSVKGINALLSDVNSSSKGIIVLNAYIDFLTNELLRSLVSTKAKKYISFCPHQGININSFIVDVNKVNSLRECFSSSFLNIREIHYGLLKRFYIGQMGISSSEYNEWVRKCLLKSRYTISFYRNKILFLMCFL
ncbi:hypothetical protein AB834_02320 [PVC group bacterium (ex Bugula neritina AB1)]|nr:hypothetical protein AB834_02320 [PVC group bacterium (ex Bugula neritina AB1)]